MRRTLQLAAIALAIRELFKVNERIDHLAQAIGHMTKAELEFFVLNAPRRVSSLETRVDAFGAVLEIVQRSQAHLQDTLDAITVARRDRDPEDATT